MRTPIIILMLIVSAQAMLGYAGNDTARELKLSEEARAVGDDRPKQEAQKTLNEIFEGLKRLKTKYPQLAQIEHATLTESQLAYAYGHVQCPSKAQPCRFGKNACRVTVNIVHITKREEADLHAAESELFEVGDGTYLDIYFGVLAEPTATGKAFESEVNQVISARLKNLRERLVSKS